MADGIVAIVVVLSLLGCERLAGWLKSLPAKRRCGDNRVMVCCMAAGESVSHEGTVEKSIEISVVAYHNNMMMVTVASQRRHARAEPLVER